MSVEALGGYLRQLCTAQKMTGKAVASAIGTNQNYLWHIEQGTMGELSARLIAAMLRAVNGSADDALPWQHPAKLIIMASIVPRFQ